MSNNSVEWSNFGNYLNGSLSPFFGLLAFIGVLFSIKIQDNESEKRATENLLIKQIEFHHTLCNNVLIPINVTQTSFNSGKTAFGFLFEKHLKSFYKDIDSLYPNLEEKQKVERAFERLYNKYGARFGFYFRNLYYLVKYIDESQRIDKSHFIRLVRAQLSSSEIQMLMYNCLFSKGENFKVYVEKYGLLNGIDDSEMLNKSHKNLFANSAFE